MIHGAQFPNHDPKFGAISRRADQFAGKAHGNVSEWVGGLLCIQQHSALYTKHG